MLTGCCEGGGSPRGPGALGWAEESGLQGEPVRWFLTPGTGE